MTVGVKLLCVIVAQRYFISKKSIRRQDQNLRATLTEQMFFAVSFPQKSEKYCVPVLSGTKIPDPIYVPIREYIGEEKLSKVVFRRQYIAAPFP